MERLHNYANLTPLATEPRSAILNLSAPLDDTVFDSLVINAQGVTTKSTANARSVPSTISTYSKHSIAWTMSSSLQTLYLDGINSRSNNVTLIQNYINSVQLTVNGLDRPIYELLIYNYDMLNYDVEKIAQN